MRLFKIYLPALCFIYIYIYSCIMFCYVFKSSTTGSFNLFHPIFFIFYFFLFYSLVSEPDWNFFKDHAYNRPRGSCLSEPWTPNIRPKACALAMVPMGLSGALQLRGPLNRRQSISSSLVAKNIFTVTVYVRIFIYIYICVCVLLRAKRSKRQRASGASFT